MSHSDLGTSRQSPGPRRLGGCRPRGPQREARALTPGHDLPLQLVPGQVEHPEDGVVQEDQGQHEEEVPGKAEDGQGVEYLLPAGQEDGTCGEGSQEAAAYSPGGAHPIPSPSGVEAGTVLG